MHLTGQGTPEVWKTNTLTIQGDTIWMTVPLEDAWELSLPLDERVSVYIMARAEMIEFDSKVRKMRLGEQTFLAVERPPGSTWKKSEISANYENRKFLRIEVSLPANCTMIIPTMSGKSFRTTEPRRCRLHDINIEGASMLLDFEPAVDHLMEVKVLSHNFPLHVQGRVIRAKPFAHPRHKEFSYNAAITFVNLSPVMRDMIGTYILERKKEKGPELY